MKDDGEKGVILATCYLLLATRLSWACTVLIEVVVEASTVSRVVLYNGIALDLLKGSGDCGVCSPRINTVLSSIPLLAYPLHH